MTPRISILLPAYEAAATLEGCLRSVARQSEARWECIVVDDGSSDATPEIARAFAAEDPRFRLVSVPHGGIVRALETGLGRCTGAFVARMDADDWMHRDRLALQLEHLERHPEHAAVGCRVRVFPRAHLQAGRREYERWINAVASPDEVRREAFVECPIAHPTLMIRRPILAELGYRDRGWPEDYDLVLRLLAAEHQIAVVPRRLLGWRDGPTRLSRTHAAYALERFTACKADHLANGLLAHHSRYVLWGYGQTGRALRRALLAHGREPERIVEMHPRRLGQTIHGALVIPPSALKERSPLPVIVSVAGAGPRGEIRRAMHEMSYREGRDFICAA